MIVIPHLVANGAQVQTMIRRYVKELMAVTPNDWRDATVLWPEHVNRVGGMTKSSEALGILKDFDAHRDSCSKKVKGPVIYAEFNRRVTLHAFLSWQTLIPAQVHASSSPHQ
jgi:hypothetical protein